MDERELRNDIADYAELFSALPTLSQYRERFCVADEQLATALCELYGIRGAYRILQRLYANAAISGEDDTDVADSCSLPQYEVVEKASQALLIAVASRDQSAAGNALEQMGILGLCPTPTHLLPRMELVADRIKGRPQQIFWVELSWWLPC